MVLSIAALGGLAFASSGCVVHTSDTLARTGFLTVQWSLAGTFSPVACADFGVSEVEVAAFDTGGSFVAQQNVPCEAHDAQLELYPGTYSVDVTMLDSRGAARSTTLHLPPTYVYADTNVTLDTDFPSSSFY